MPYNPLRDIDYAVTDPAFTDPEFPASFFPADFPSCGSTIFGQMYVAQGQGQKKCLIMVPEFLGGDRLRSLIYPVLHSGVNVLTFYPRGLWDRTQQWSFMGAIDDVHSAIAFLRSSRSVEKYRTDPEEIFVCGMSGTGGNVGWAACAEDPRIRGAIGVALYDQEQARPLDEWIDRQRPHFQRMKDDSGGRVDLEAWTSVLTDESVDRLSVVKQASSLASRKLLLIGAAFDTVSPLDLNHRKIAAALREVGADLTDVIFDSDHMLTTKRIALSRLVITWLNENPGR